MSQPRELLRGLQFKGPALVSVNSGPTQFAGRTTLNSGSATVVVSTFAVKSNSLIHFGLEGNANLNLAYGTLAIGSGALSGTVSNAAIAADSLVFLQDRAVAAQKSGNAVA